MLESFWTLKNALVPFAKVHRFGVEELAFLNRCCEGNPHGWIQPSPCWIAAHGIPLRHLRPCSAYSINNIQQQTIKKKHEQLQRRRREQQLLLFFFLCFFCFSFFLALLRQLLVPSCSILLMYFFFLVADHCSSFCRSWCSCCCFLGIRFSQNQSDNNQTGNVNCQHFILADLVCN